MKKRILRHTKTAGNLVVLESLDNDLADLSNRAFLLTCK